MSKNPFLTAALAALLLTAPLGAYTVFLKDGAKLIAKEPPEIRGNTALIVLQNGTQTSLDAAEIDFERTREANQRDLGGAVILEDGERTVEPGGLESEPRRTLTDLSARTRADRREGSSRSGTAARSESSKRASSDLDLLEAERNPYRNLEIAAEIQEVFRAQDVLQTRLYQGTKKDRVLIDLTTDSEAAVFRGLKVAATALVHLQTKSPRSVGAFELVLTTSDRARAGEFILDAKSAALLASGEIEPSAFFVERVRF